MQLSVLKTTLMSFVCVGFTGLLTGCQCTSLTDDYSDMIDDISDLGFCMDCYYHPCWDLSRIGHSDWEACKFNRAWCGACGEQSRSDESSHCHECSQFVEEHSPAE